MVAICQWNCSDNYVDDRLETPIIYTSPTGGREWLDLRNETGKALYPPSSMGIGPQGFSAYTAAGGRATFNFLGQEVAVYATEFDADTESSYTLDGKVASNRTSQGAGVGVLLFHSGVLSGTTHTLVIDVTQASDTSPFTLDWIEYNNTVRGVTPLVPNPSYAPSPSQSSPSPSLAKSSSTVSALASGNASKPSVSSAAVAGGVVGGLVGLTAILLAYLTLRSRRRWRMSRTTKYGYGEVAQRDSDSLVVPPTDTGIGPPPTILITHTDDTTSLRNINPSNVSVSTSNQAVLLGSSREHRPGLGSSKRESYSDTPPAYTP